MFRAGRIIFALQVAFLANKKHKIIFCPELHKGMLKWKENERKHMKMKKNI